MVWVTDDLYLYDVSSENDMPIFIGARIESVTFGANGAVDAWENLPHDSAISVPLHSIKEGAVKIQVVHVECGRPDVYANAEVIAELDGTAEKYLLGLDEPAMPVILRVHFEGMCIRKGKLATT